MQGYPRGNRELLGPFSKTFGPKETYSWFREKLAPLKASLKTEQDGRVFPSTDNSSTIVNMLTSQAKKLGIEIRTGMKVKSVTCSSVEDFGMNLFQIECVRSGPDPASVTLTCDRVIIATGSAKLASIFFFSFSKTML